MGGSLLIGRAYAIKPMEKEQQLPKVLWIGLFSTKNPALRTAGRDNFLKGGPAGRDPGRYEYEKALCVQV